MIHCSYGSRPSDCPEVANMHIGAVAPFEVMARRGSPWMSVVKPREFCDACVEFAKSRLVIEILAWRERNT